MIKTFRNLFAILLAVVVFPIIWAAQGIGYLQIPEGVIGASIAIETMIAQFYFRKSGPSDTPPTQ